MLLTRIPHLGNLAIIDMRKQHRIHMLKNDFDRLTVDPYIKEGYRHKHIVRYIYKASSLYVKQPLAPLLQSSKVNPVHGDIAREYPEYITYVPSTIVDILDAFVLHADIPRGGQILVQAQRVTCSAHMTGLPSVENWHRDGVEKIGIICISRHNIKGGLNQFKKDDEDVTSYMLEPGVMVVFEDAEIKHRVTPIYSADASSIGYRDVLLLGYV